MRPIPRATSFDDVPFDRWRELNADGLIVGTVQKTGDGDPRRDAAASTCARGQSAFARQYDGTAANPRLFAHTISDEIHKSQRALNGVARSKLTFDSDRDGERMSGTVQNRSIKEIYISDYDGENQRRVTVGKTLNIAPRWSPDGRSIAYTSYRRGGANIFISNIFQGTLDEVTKGDKVGENWLPAWSPDGTRIAFSSTRDGNPEIYVVNRDGSNVRRITNHPSIDITPTWSPTGHADRVHLRPHRHAADLRRRRRRVEPEQAELGWLLRPADLVAGAVQRDRLLVAQRAGLRHQGHRPGDRRDPPRSPSARAPTRARRSRRTAATSSSPRRARARRRCSRWRATARTCGRLPGPATTKSRTGPNDWRIER